MPDGEVVQTISRTSVHEDIIREVEETDWTVDPNEGEDVLTCSTANAANSKEDVASNGHNVENEEEDIEFDPDELECVDEDADEERREREERIREESRRGEKRKQEEKRRHHLDGRLRHEVDRHHPYSRHERGDRRDFRSAREIGRADRHRIEQDRHRMAFDRRPRRVESYSRKRQRRSTDDKVSRDKRDGDERDIPFEELDLEEVDCCDEVGDDGSEFTDGASGTGESQTGEDDDIDDVSMSRSRGPNHGCNVDDGDDFPDLCEEIDEEAMRRAAAAAAAKNIDLSQGSSTKTISSPPPDTDEMVSKPRETPLSHRRDFDSRKHGPAASSRHSGSNRNGERHEDEARRRHHHTGRNEYRSRRDDRRHADERRRRDRTRERLDKSGVHSASTPAKPEATELCKREDVGLISVKGPLAHGWYSVDELPSTSSSPDPNLIDSEHRKGDSAKHGSVTAMESSIAEKRSAKFSAEISPPRHTERHSTPNTVRLKHHGVSPFASPKRKDHGLRGSPKEYSSSPKRKSSDHHQQQQLQANGTTAIHGSSNTGKIPSLLDMCIKEPKELQQGSASLNGIGSRLRMDETSGQIQRRDVMSEKEVPKSRSLLDLDIPPPDRKLMRQYAIVLNSLELTQRPSYARAEKRKMEVPSKVARLSSPRSSDDYERSRQPRSYVHGMRKLSQ